MHSYAEVITVFWFTIFHMFPMHLYNDLRGGKPKSLLCLLLINLPSPLSLLFRLVLVSIKLMPPIYNGSVVFYGVHYSTNPDVIRDSGCFLTKRTE